MKSIILNGTSSSGKTSIVRALQQQSEIPLIHASVDAFLNMIFWKHVKEDDKNQCFNATISNFHKCLPVLASDRFPVVVDHVFEKNEWYEECRSSFDDILLIGVMCPLAILEKREQKRGDRKPGLAKAQFEHIHEEKKYDLEVDTSKLSSEECARLILQKFNTINC